MPKERTIDEMAGFLVRWTDADVQNDIPRRLKAAIKSSGAERAPLARTLLIRWLEDIERHGPAQINYAVGAINERPEKEYGAREDDPPPRRRFVDTTPRREGKKRK